MGDYLSVFQGLPDVVERKGLEPVYGLLLGP